LGARRGSCGRPPRRPGCGWALANSASPTITAGDRFFRRPPGRERLCSILVNRRPQPPPPCDGRETGGDCYRRSPLPLGRCIRSWHEGAGTSRRPRHKWPGRTLAAFAAFAAARGSDRLRATTAFRERRALCRRRARRPDCGWMGADKMSRPAPGSRRPPRARCRLRHRWKDVCQAGSAAWTLLRRTGEKRAAHSLRCCAVVHKATAVVSSAASHGSVVRRVSAEKGTTFALPGMTT
jgi:hypothetical protein